MFRQNRKGYAGKNSLCVYVVFINYPYVRRTVRRGVLCHPLSEFCVFVLVVFLIFCFVKGLKQPFCVFILNVVQQSSLITSRTFFHDS